MKSITSRRNPNIVQLAKLIANKKERDITGLFVCEGATLCADLAESGVEIEKVFLTQSAIERYTEESDKILSVASKSWIISDEISAQVSDTKTPQGIFAVAKKLDNSESIARIMSDGHYVILDNLQDPGNVGTIIRTALALNIDTVFISSDSAEIYSPRTLRAAMGSVFRIPIVVEPDISSCIKRLKAKNIKVYATALTETAVPVDKKSFLGSSAVLMGNEGAGLSEERINLCDKSIIIPMSANAESLNVSVAAGIFIWEMVSGSKEY